jgi:hypothetical protein
MRIWYRLSLAALISAISSGCGIVDDDPPSVNLSSLQKQFSIDATTWSVNSTSAVALTNQACTPNAVPDACAIDAATLSICKAATCTATCNELTSRCELSLRVELWRSINLPIELPKLEPATNTAMVSSLEVMLDDLTYQVSENALNVDTPALSIYVSPATVMRPSGEGAVRIAEIPSVPATTDLSARGVTFLPGGKEILRRRLSDFQVPFNLLIASDLIVDFATPIPTGRLNAALTVEGSAGF